MKWTFGFAVHPSGGKGWRFPPIPSPKPAVECAPLSTCYDDHLSRDRFYDQQCVMGLDHLIAGG